MGAALCLDLTPVEVCTALRELCGLPNVQLSDAARIARVIDWHEQGLDFADAFHLSACDRCRQLRTFDARFVQRAAKLGPCPVARVGTR